MSHRIRHMKVFSPAAHITIAVAIIATLSAGPALAQMPVVADWTFRSVLTPTYDGVEGAYVTYDPDAPGADVNGPYRMWYRAYSGHTLNGTDWIEHAWRHDGVNFHSQQTVHAADPRGDTLPGSHRTGRPLVVKQGSNYSLYHWQYYFWSPHIPEWSGCTDMAQTSSDGLSFSGHVEHVIDPMGMTAGWDTYATEPRSILYENGQYVMYYTSTGDPYTGEGNSIGRAVSADGVNWPTAEGADRQQVMTNGAAGTWNDNVCRPSVAKPVGEDDYWMFFGSNSGIGFARSEDGVTWTDSQHFLDRYDLTAGMGEGIHHVADPYYFLDPVTGKEYLYFTYVPDATNEFSMGRVELVPEPTTLSLLAIGALSLLKRKK